MQPAPRGDPADGERAFKRSVARSPRSLQGAHRKSGKKKIKEREGGSPPRRGDARRENRLLEGAAVGDSLRLVDKVIFGALRCSGNKGVASAGRNQSSVGGRGSERSGRGRPCVRLAARNRPSRSCDEGLATWTAGFLGRQQQTGQGGADAGGAPPRKPDRRMGR